ncbi:MAG: hypothetical protein JWP97_1519 [Labilithrix sp.]|nr:hypothetical protein [Labilithrix sp.]
MSDKSERKRSSKKRSGPKRSERRFVPHSANSPWLVRALGGLGAMVLGAGAWAYLYSDGFKRGAEEFRAANPQGAPVPADLIRMEAIPLYMIAFAAVLLGIAIWLGTSSEPPLRVGDPGVAMERGEVRRMPWWGITQIVWEAGTHALVLTGTDEAGAAWIFKVPAKAHPEAAGWILKEALARIPKAVDITDNVLEGLPGAAPTAGMIVELEPLQVVGKKDAITGKLISYEPDARICTRCERVYFKRSVPKKCKCGASLAHLRTSLGQDENDDEDGDDEVDSERAPASEES